jgi:hypothetical protein
MTKEQIKNWLPIMQAWVDGKPVEYRTEDGKWHPLCDGHPFAFSDIDATEGVPYRIAPTPKLRPWTAADKPDICGRLIDVWTHDQSKPSLVLAVEGRGVRVTGSGADTVFINWDELFRGGKVSRDFGKTWEPCGVLE